MVKNHRLFLKEPAGVVSIRNDAGLEFSSSIEEFERLAGVSFEETLERLAFEPSHYDGILHDWEVDGEPGTEFTESRLEAYIASIPAYLERQADPFYMATLEEAKLRKQHQVVSLVGMAKQAVYDVGANKLDPSGLQSMEEMLSLALLAKAQGDTVWTIDVIMANDNPDGTARRVTLDATTVIAQIRNIKQRNENLNQSAQDHVDAITLLTTVEEVRDYVLPVV